MNQRSYCHAPFASQWSWLLCVAALGCGDLAAPVGGPGPGGGVGDEPDGIGPILGGQSGGEGSTTCEFERKPVATATSQGLPLSEWLTPFRAAFARPMLAQWWPTVREPTPIRPTELALLELQVDDSIQEGCEQFQIDVAFDARSEDGQLDGHFEGKLVGYASGERILQLRAAMVDGEFRDGPARAGIDPDAQLSVALTWRASDPDLLTGTLEAGPDATSIAWFGRDAQTWSASPTPPKERRELTLSQLQSSICRDPAPTARAGFASEAALRDALANTWVACSGAGRVDPDFAGLSIDANGHWHDLRVDGDALVAVQGFGYEGQVARNVYGGDFNLALLDRLPERYEFANAELSADGSTLRLMTQGSDGTLAATFLASDLPVQYPPRRYAKGTRAGMAACEHDDEVEITSRPTSESELRGLLVGRWLFCSGGFGTSQAGVVFGADDSFRYLEADGGESQEPAGKFVIIDTSSQNGPGAYQINLLTATGDGLGAMTLPLFSSSPLKLIANDEYQSVLSAI